MSKHFEVIPDPKHDYKLVSIPARKRVGWKKAYSRGNTIIVKLEIREYVRTHFQFGKSYENIDLRKCRTKKTKVLGYYKINDDKTLTPIKKPRKVYSGHDPDFIYPEVGEWVKAIWFDTSSKICSNGIHFFLDKEDAISW